MNSKQILTPITIAFAMMIAAGCSTSSATSEPAPDASTGADTGGDTGIEPDGAGNQDAAQDVGQDTNLEGWAEVDKAVAEAFDKGKLQGPFVTLEVFDESGKKLHSVTAGQEPGHDEPIPVASASKWVSSTVFLSLVQDGTMSLDDTTGKILGWTEPEVKDIALRHLLSFSSGLNKNLCTYNPGITLDACVEKIHQEGLESGAVVGKTFRYGSQHMAVAAAMAQKVTGKTWKELFTERVAGPAGFTAQDIYYTIPVKKNGETNPLVAGGLTISINDYERFLTTLQGIGHTPLISSSLFAQQHAEQWPTDLTVAYSPNPGIHYAFGCWRECATPNDVPACDNDLLVHSAGAFGFVPFIDVKNHLYGVLAAQSESATSGAGSDSTKVLNELRPMIATAATK